MSLLYSIQNQNLLFKVALVVTRIISNRLANESLRINQIIMSKNYIRLFTLMVIFTLSAWNVEAKFGVSTPMEEQVNVEDLSSKKLSIKEKIALKKLEKQAQKKAKQAKKGTKAQGNFLGKVILGIILVILGALVILGGVFSLSIGSLLLGIAGIAVGGVVIAWGVLDIVL